MDELFPRFELCLIELAVLLDDFAPDYLMRDIEFFIMEPHMSAVCRTNTKLAYQIGGLAAKATRTNALLIQALYLLFNARDGMLKGYIKSEIIHLLDNSEKLIKLAKEYHNERLLV